MVNHPDDKLFEMPGPREQTDSGTARNSSANPTPGPDVEFPSRGGNSAGGLFNARTRARIPGRPDEAADEAWQQRARAVFDESIERLDARTRSKLTQARFAALDALKTAEARQRWRRLPVAGVVAATVATVAILTWNGDSQQVTPGELPLEDMELVADIDSLQLLQDVEFYAWLGGQ